MDKVAYRGHARKQLGSNEKTSGVIQKMDRSTRSLPTFFKWYGPIREPGHPLRGRRHMKPCQDQTMILAFIAMAAVMWFLFLVLNI